MQGRNREEGHQVARKALSASESVCTPFSDLGLYHKATPYKMACRALHASNLPFKMGR